MRKFVIKAACVRVVYIQIVCSKISVTLASSLITAIDLDGRPLLLAYLSDSNLDTKH